MEISTKSKRISVSAIFLYILVLFFQSCKKEDSDIGLAVTPEDDLLNATMTDTFFLETYTELEDSLRTSNLYNCMLGSYVDPVFGKSASQIYTQFGLSTTLSTIDISNTTIDSVTLQLSYDGYYGNLDAQTFSVKRITQKFFKDSSYYSNTSLTTDGIELINPGKETLTPDPVNNTIVGSDTLEPLLVLSLKNSLGLDILNAVGTGGLASETAFNDFFYGLNISVNNPTQSSGQGSIHYFNMSDAQTKMVIYYTENSVVKQISFPVGTNQSRFSAFSHDYTGTAIEQQLLDPSKGQQFFYLQAMAGLRSIVKIRGIDGLKNLGNVIINKAELYLPVQYFTTDKYKPSTNTYIFYKNSENVTSVTVDQILSPSTYGGTYADDKKSYVFNIGRHVQRVVRGELENLNYVINIGLGSVSANRVVLSGQNSPNREKPYLKIYYTKY